MRHHDYPVHYTVVPPAEFTRWQLLGRVIAFCALGVIGMSFGTVFLFMYLALPVYAASRLAARDSAIAYTTEDGPKVMAVLRWFAAIAAWAGLIVDHLPGKSPPETVALRLDDGPHTHSPTTMSASAILRVFTGLPSALVLGLLGFVGVFVWLWAALSVLFTQRVGPGAHAYLTGLQRWSVRLLAYQASLVDAYPPFSLTEGPAPLVPSARVV